MTRDDARDIVHAVLHEVAPEADLAHLSPDTTMQESLGLDSLDFLDFVAGLHRRAGIEILERDYPQLLTIEGCVSYLVSATRTAGANEAPAGAIATWTPAVNGARSRPSVV